MQIVEGCSRMKVIVGLAAWRKLQVLMARHFESSSTHPFLQPHPSRLIALELILNEQVPWPYIVKNSLFEQKLTI